MKSNMPMKQTGEWKFNPNASLPYLRLGLPWFVNFMPFVDNSAARMNIDFTQEGNQTSAIGGTSPVHTGLSVEQRHFRGSETPPFTCGKLHPSPPNSHPLPV